MRILSHTTVQDGRTLFSKLLRRYFIVALMFAAVAITTAVYVYSTARVGKQHFLSPTVKTTLATVGASPGNSSSVAEAPVLLTIARQGHTSTLLPDGRVLVVGGENQNGFVAAAEIFDPVSGNFGVSGNLNTPRADHTATRLADGRVLIAGGRGDLGALSTTEIFDPASGAFASGPNLNSSRTGQSDTILPDGRIILAGGDSAGSVEIYEPLTNAFTWVANNLNVPRAFHGAALMKDGRVLIVGGVDPNGNSLKSGEIFDPASLSVSEIEGQLTVDRVRPHLRVLFDAKVQIIGGSDDGSMEVYDPQLQAFGAFAHVQPEGDTCAGLPAQVRSSQTRAALFHNGQTEETFDRTRHTMTELIDQAVVIGGANTAGAALSSSPFFNSSSAAISTDRLDYAPGQTAYIAGRGFQPFETVRIRVHEDPHTPLERGLEVVADAEGNFVGEYAVQDYDLNMRFLVGARGLTSARTAQTTFTDASPGSLGNYATQSLTGVTASIPPSNVAANVTFSNLTRGTGLTATSATAAFSSSGWTTAASPDANDYYEFTITPGSGYQFSASEVRVGLERSLTGPASAVLRTSLDGYASNIGSIISVPTTNAIFTINLSSVLGLQNSTSAVSLRIYGYGASGSGGTMRIQRVTTPTAMVGLEVDGSVASTCSAPSSASLTPVSQTLKVGDSLTLNAAVTGGEAPYNYVYRQGAAVVATHTDIISATDSWVKSNLAESDAGSYTVEITSSGCVGAGTVTSSSAGVTVDGRTASVAVSFASNPITYGSSTAATVTVTDTDTGTVITPSGPVNFSSSSGDNFNSTTCNLIESLPGTATCTVTVSPTHASTHNISASWSGDDAHTAPLNGSAGLNVNPKPITANITVSNKPYDGNTSATITSGSLSDVAPGDTTAEVNCSIDTATANFLSAEAGFSKTVNASGLTLTGTKISSYSFAGTATGIANIDKADPQVTTGGNTCTYSGSSCSGSGSATGGAGESLSFTLTYTGTGATTYGPTSLAPTAVGTYQVVAHTDGDSNNNPKDSEPAAVTIGKASSTTVVSCPPSVVYNGSAQTPCAALVTGDGGLHLTPTPTYSNNTNAGTATASYSYPGDANHTGSDGFEDFLIKKTNAVCTVTPYTVTYNSLAHTATGSCSGVDAGGAALGGTLNLTGTTHTAAGVYNDSWSFNGGANYYNQSGVIIDTINSRNGLVRYIGQLEWVTSGASATTAQVNLSASVQDPSGLGLVGATVDFIDTSNNKVLAGGVPVSPVSGSASNTGTANKIVTLGTGQYGAESYVILVKLSLNYDNTDQAIADKTATVVVSKPAATNEAIGAGTIAYLTTSAGTLRTDINAAVTYSVGLKYNKSGTNPQGKITVQIPRSDGVIFVKSNSISSMQLLSNSNPKKMTIYTKAAIFKLDALGNVTAIEGNVTLRMDIEDYSSGGPLADKVGFTVLSTKDSTLFYSNQWVLDVAANAWKTVIQQLSTGCVKIN